MNFLFLLVILAAILKVIDGYKKGMVKEIISLVSLLVLSGVVALLAQGISSYNDGKIFNVIVAVVLLVLLGIAHNLLKLVFFSAKIVSKLPVVHFLDKLLGVVFGVFEVVLLLWTVYTLVMMLELGALEEIILSYTRENELLAWLYRYNYLAYAIEKLLAKFSFVPLADIINGACVRLSSF